MTNWRLDMLGGFTLSDGTGAGINISSRKEKMLLARLAIDAGKPVSRDRIIGMLWPDRGEEQARTSLRQSLAGLRACLWGTESIINQQDSIVLDSTGLNMDVQAFSNALAHEELNSCLALYRGPLLDGVELPTAESETWLAVERQRFEDMAELAVERAVALGEKNDEVLTAAKTILKHNPLRESVHRSLMRLYMNRGQRSKSLAAYAACAAVLRAELNVSPDVHTERLYRDILVNGGSDGTLQSASSQNERPFLAVMPFSNLTGDQRFGVICEGLAEDIVTGLGKFRLFDVIDRNSTSAVARRTEDSHEIGNILGAAYVVQGSLSKLSKAVRVTVRLVTAANRAQVWAEQFECAMDELPSLPSTIGKAIVITLQSRVESSLMEQVQRKTSLAAYECVLRGVKHLRGYGPDDNQLAIEWFDKALAQDPDYPLARAYRAFAGVVVGNYGDAPHEVLLSAKASVKLALTSEPHDSRIHWLLGLICGCLADFNGEVQAYKRALELNPNDANALASYGLALSAIGRFDEGIGYIREAMRINPFHPEYYWVDLGCAFFSAQRLEDAIEAFGHRSFPKPYVLGRLAACYALLGRTEEAARTVTEILRQQPDFKISTYRMSAWDEDTRILLGKGMKLAGLLD